MQFFKDDGCLFSLLGRENRTASRKQERVTHFFVEHRNSSSAGNVPVENPRRGPRRGTCRDTGVELCPSVILQG